MIARDIEAGAGSDSAVGDGTGVSVSTRSVPSGMPDALAAKRSHLSMQPGQTGSVATRARAESFLVWARAVARSGRAALVPLGHTYGVDLLLITSNTRLP